MALFYHKEEGESFNWKVFLLKYGITTLLATLACIGILSSREFSSVTDTVTRYNDLCDAFSVPGTLLILFGILIAVSNEGAFYALTWLVQYAGKTLIPGQHRMRENYGDYVLRKRGKGKTGGYGFLFVVGGIFLAIGLAFMGLFYSVYVG